MHRSLISNFKIGVVLTIDVTMPFMPCGVGGRRGGGGGGEGGGDIYHARNINKIDSLLPLCMTYLPPPGHLSTEDPNNCLLLGHHAE